MGREGSGETIWTIGRRPAVSPLSSAILSEVALLSYGVAVAESIPAGCSLKKEGSGKKETLASVNAGAIS